VREKEVGKHRPARQIEQGRVLEGFHRAISGKRRMKGNHQERDGVGGVARGRVRSECETR